MWFFLIASITLTLSPGPDIIYVLVQSMANGRQRGMAIACGLVTGVLVHTSLVAFGVAILISQHEILYTLLKFFGSGYLLYLAFQVYNSETNIALVETQKSQKTFLEAFKKGFVMNVLNPKVTLFFLAFLPSFIPKHSENIILDTYVLGFLFMFQALIIFILVSILADKLFKKWRNHQTFGLFMKYIQIIVFISLALFLWMF
jgi:threonine/homoserine/homoserine lactone efflux protein